MKKKTSHPPPTSINSIKCRNFENSISIEKLNKMSNKKNDDFHMSGPPPKTTFKQFLYNPDTKQVLGRTLQSWCKLPTSKSIQIPPGSSPPAPPPRSSSPASILNGEREREREREQSEIKNGRPSIFGCATFPSAFEITGGREPGSMDSYQTTTTTTTQIDDGCWVFFFVCLLYLLNFYSPDPGVLHRPLRFPGRILLHAPLRVLQNAGRWQAQMDAA